jgi:hypothetical protein
LSFDQIAKLLKGKNPGYGLLLEHRETFPLIGSPSLRYPLDDPLRPLAEEEVLAFVFAGWGAIGVLILGRKRVA